MIQPCSAHAKSKMNVSAHKEIISRQKKNKDKENVPERAGYKKGDQHSHRDPEQSIPCNSFHRHSPENPFI